MLAGTIATTSAVVIASGAGVYAWGVVAPSSQIFGPTIRRIRDKRAIALTFDDGPNPALTRQLLDLLDSHSARATFFVIGNHVRACPSLAKEIAEAGHTIGNHTETHPRLTFLTAERIRQELSSCKEAIIAATGKAPRWMRPPYGFRNRHVNAAARQSGCEGVVMWSQWGWDWKVREPERVIDRLRRVGGGDIVLLHDGDHRVLEGDRRHTLKALEYWLPRWKDAGLRFVTIDG